MAILQICHTYQNNSRTTYLWTFCYVTNTYLYVLNYYERALVLVSAYAF